MKAVKRSVNDSLREDFPLLWERAQLHDDRERLGGDRDPIGEEIDKAMRELHSARAYVREGHPS